ncbi:unnamed protein product [Effrenium voratum]|nr:unnamed protein product [Effrenium voratum]
MDNLDESRGPSLLEQLSFLTDTGDNTGKSDRRPTLHLNERWGVPNTSNAPGFIDDLQYSVNQRRPKGRGRMQDRPSIFRRGSQSAGQNGCRCTQTEMCGSCGMCQLCFACPMTSSTSLSGP